MLQLKNRLFQPLVLHRADGTTLHLLARGTATLREDEVSADIRRAVSKGQVTQTVIPEPKPAPTPIPPKRGRKGGRK